MRLDFFVQKTSNKFLENRLLKFVVIVLAVIEIYNTTQIQKAINSHRTIITPPVISSSFEVMGDNASDDYFMKMARYISSLTFSYTPLNAKNQFGELLTLYNPDSYPKGKSDLLALAELIENTHITQVFFISDVEIERKDNKNKIIIKGDKKISDDTKTPMDTIKTTFIIEYKMSDGKFSINRIYEEEKP